MTSFLRCVPHKRDPPQALFLYPFDVLIQETINQKDVESTLVVGNKNIGLTGVQLLMSFCFHAAECQPTGDSRPPVRGVIAPSLASEKRCHDHYHHRSNDRYQNKQRRENDPLVQKTQKISHYFYQLQMSNVQK